MIIYSVTCTVDADIAQAWEQFFVDKHLDDLVRTGYFTGYSFRRIIEETASDKVRFTSEYFTSDLEQLKRYNETAAAALKKEVSDLFQGKYSCSRQIYEEVKGR